MRRFRAVVLAVSAVAALVAGAGVGFEANPVFSVELAADRDPLVAGETARLAVVLTVDDGWHVNSDTPGDDFSMPTTLEWELPDGWTEPTVSFPEGRSLRFAFSPDPIEVWEGREVIVGGLTVPASAEPGPVRLGVQVVAQACNDRECLPPTPVTASLSTEVATAGSASSSRNTELFPEVEVAGREATDGLGTDSLPLLLIGVFLGGLALNLTPCVFPLIPITIGFFTQQTKDREGSAFPLALAYVIGIALTYSVLGVAAALGGMILGGALQHPAVIGVIVVVLLALAASMFGLWEIRIPLPGWAQGGKGGILGALLMGLVMGLVAAPCIGPFVLGLVTLVAQRGDPVYGFGVFFVLSLGLGLPYLVLGTFTGLLNRLPASGMWMVGIRKVLGVVLVAMAAYFAAPLVPDPVGAMLLPVVLGLGAVYLLVVDRTAHDQPTLDRVMRLACAGMLVAAVALMPAVEWAPGLGGGAESADQHLRWQPYEEAAVERAVAAGGPVILDFYADWCAPCKELEEKTFNSKTVRPTLTGYSRFKIDLTRSDEATTALTRRYEVRGVPTVIVYADGEEAFRITGFEPPEVFGPRLEGL